MLCVAAIVNRSLVISGGEDSAIIVTSLVDGALVSIEKLIKFYLITIFWWVILTILIIHTFSTCDINANL